MKTRPRDQAATVLRVLRALPAVFLVGPRQSGKSTLVKTLLPDWTRLDLERPADLQSLSADIEGFFRSNPRRVVIDEAQALPELSGRTRRLRRAGALQRSGARPAA